MKIGQLEIDPLWLVIGAAAWAGYAIVEMDGGPENLSTAGQIATTLLVVVIAIATSIVWRRRNRRP